MSDTLPTREEIAAIVLSEVKTVRANEIAEKLLARLRPAWERMEKTVSDFDERDGVREVYPQDPVMAKVHEVYEKRIDALRADLERCRAMAPD